MKTRVKINVTKEDIEYGLPGEPSHCPVARATERAIRNAEYVTSNGNTLGGVVRIDYEVYRFKLPKKADKFIDQFDDDKTGKPFSFIANLKKEK